MNAGRPITTWVYSYEELEKLTGIKQNSIQVAVSRGRRGMPGGFVPEDFRSVVRWIFRNASDDLRLDIMSEMGFFRDKQNARRTLQKKKLRRSKSPNSARLKPLLVR